MDELAGVDHRITSSSKNSENFKPSLEGLSEREVRILVQDQFTPVTSRQGHHANFPLQSNVQIGSGLPTASTSPQELQNTPTIRHIKIASASGDLSMTGKDREREKNEEKDCDCL